jgi:cytochrome c peroxidase
MNNELDIGLLAVALGTTLLLLAVLRELAPAGGLTGRGRWLLAAALGSGVLAFAVKLTLVAWLVWLPLDAVPRQAARQSAPAFEPADTEAVVGNKPYVWQALPRVAPAPSGNAGTPEQVALGEQLFFDRNLSADRQLACASCHDLAQKAGADGRRTSLGIQGQVGARNAPTVINAAFQAWLFWDGRADSLEAQATGPLVNAVEMGMPSLQAVVQRVREDRRYAAAFRAAFPAALPANPGDESAITIERIAAAIAAFERTLITPDSPYDRFVGGDIRVLDAQAQRGMALFDAVGCTQCHGGPNFSSASVFEAGPAWRLFPAWPDAADPALQLARDPGLAPPGSTAGVWRVPSLRNVADTAPYFHNGAVDDLDEAVRIMARTQLGWQVVPGGDAVPLVRWKADQQTMALLAPRTLPESAVQDITVFLRALSAPVQRR